MFSWCYLSNHYPIFTCIMVCIFALYLCIMRPEVTFLRKWPSLAACDCVSMVTIASWRQLGTLHFHKAESDICTRDPEKRFLGNDNWPHPSLATWLPCKVAGLKFDLKVMKSGKPPPPPPWRMGGGSWSDTLPPPPHLPLREPRGKKPTWPY